MNLLIAFGFGALVGLTLGLLGGGGSVLILPALVYALGIEEKMATTMSQVVVGTSSFFAAAMHGWVGYVRVGVALIMFPSGAVGAYFGGWVKHRVPGAVILISFAVLLLITSLLMLRSASRNGQEPEKDGDVRQQSVWALVVAGLAVGFLTGFLGVGGGFILVPALAFVGLPVKQAVGTSLLVIGMNCSASLAIDFNSTIDWAVTAAFTASALLTSIAASFFAKHLKSATQQRLFAWLLLVVGILILTDKLSGLG